jgi:hypothetical protein
MPIFRGDAINRGARQAAADPLDRADARTRRAILRTVSPVWSGEWSSTKINFQAIGERKRQPFDEPRFPRQFRSGVQILGTQDSPKT